MSVKPIRINVIEKNRKPLKDSQPELKDESKFEAQLEIFQSSMKYCIVTGQCLGIFPFVNMTGRDVQNVTYKMFSWKYLLCYIILVAETLAAVLILLRLFSTAISLSSIRFIILSTGNVITSILFIRLSTKWRHLMEIVATSKLNEYVDSSLKSKCKFASIALLSFAFFVHIIAKTYKILRFYNCHWSNGELISYEQYLRHQYNWAFDHKLPYSIVTGILIQIFQLITSLIWSYSHLFVICISFYLASILELLNKKILSIEGKDVQASHWRALREDYNRATLLVRSFDDAINSIIFVLTAIDLFFVCSQLYFLIGELSLGFTSRPCPKNSSGFLIGYEYSTFLIISGTFYAIRFFAVLLVAAKIHTASIEPVPSLHNVSTSSYCSEVQRFIEKINGDTVALSGLNFFYITREMVLSVIGTIVTYELVLLQFNRN